MLAPTATSLSCVTFADETDNTVLTSWQDEPPHPVMLAAMTNASSDVDVAVELGEDTVDEQAAADETVPPITYDWAPEVGEYRFSTT